MSSPAIVSSIAMYALVLYGCKFIHKPTLISGAVIPLSLILLVASGSRTSLGQSVIGIFVFLVLSNCIDDKFFYRIQQFSRKYFLFIVAILMASLISIGAGLTIYGPRVQITNGFADRIQHWNQGLIKYFSSSPLGNGLLHKYFRDGSFAVDYFHEANDPHNLLIGLMIVAGIFLRFSFFAFIVALGASSKSLHLKKLMWRLSGLLIAVCSGFLFGGSLISPASLDDKLFWMLAGYLFLQFSVKQGVEKDLFP